MLNEMIDRDKQSTNLLEKLNNLENIINSINIDSTENSILREKAITQLTHIKEIYDVFSNLVKELRDLSLQEYSKFEQKHCLQKAKDIFYKINKINDALIINAKQEKKSDLKKCNSLLNEIALIKEQIYLYIQNVNFVMKPIMETIADRKSKSIEVIQNTTKEKEENIINIFNSKLENTKAYMQIKNPQEEQISKNTLDLINYMDFNITNPLIRINCLKNMFDFFYEIDKKQAEQIRTYNSYVSPCFYINFESKLEIVYRINVLLFDIIKQINENITFSYKDRKQALEKIQVLYNNIYNMNHTDDLIGSITQVQEILPIQKNNKKLLKIMIDDVELEQIASEENYLANKQTQKLIAENANFRLENQKLIEHNLKKQKEERKLNQFIIKIFNTDNNDLTYNENIIKLIGTIDKEFDNPIMKVQVLINIVESTPFVLFETSSNVKLCRCIVDSITNIYKSFDNYLQTEKMLLEEFAKEVMTETAIMEANRNLNQKQQELVVLGDDMIKLQTKIIKKFYGDIPDKILVLANKNIQTNNKFKIKEQVCISDFVIDTKPLLLIGQLAIRHQNNRLEETRLQMTEYEQQQLTMNIPEERELSNRLEETRLKITEDEEGQQFTTDIQEKQELIELYEEEVKTVEHIIIEMNDKTIENTIK